MLTIEDLKDKFEALIGKRVRLTLISFPQLRYEGVLKRCAREGHPYMIRLESGGCFIPHGKLRVSEICEVA